MVIINPTVNTAPASLVRPAGPAPVLAPDRVLNAVVLGQRAQHLYELASGNLRMTAESQTPLRRGEQLQLKVTGQDAQQRPQLQILQQGGSVNIAPLLRNTLPQQQPLTQLAASLAQFAQNPGGRPELQNALALFMSIAPKRPQLADPEQLRRFVHNSGQFLEASLLAGKSTSGDLKSALLRLASQLEQAVAQTNSPGSSAPQSRPLAQSYGPASAPPAAQPKTATGDNSVLHNQRPPPSLAAYQAAKPNSELPGQLTPQARADSLPITDSEAQLKRLLQDVRGALARQEAHQLLHLQSREAGGSQQYFIELPVVDKDGMDIWQLHLQQQLQGRDEHHDTVSAADGETPEASWNITLNFDLPGLGPMKAKVRQQRNAVSIHFTAEQPKTLDMLERYRHELESRLSDQGIEELELSCDCAKLNPESTPLSSTSLLDDKA